MDMSLSNIREVKLIDSSETGPTYSCKLDLVITDIDPVSKEEFIHPDSGTVDYVSNPRDRFGLGPKVFAAIENGEYEGEIEDVSGEA